MRRATARVDPEDGSADRLLPQVSRLPAGGFLGVETLLRELIREELSALLDLKLSQHLSRQRLPALAAAEAPSAYVTRGQAAAITGYSLRTIARLIGRGELKACGPRRDRIKRFELDRMMAESPRRPPAGADPVDDVALEADRLLDDE